MTQIPDYFALGGGLDLETPPIETPRGRTIGCLNYEPRKKGYRRIDGFERYDGRPQPSLASYWVINFDAGTAAISEADIVTGGTSSATGEALFAAVVSSGSYAGNDAVGYVVLTNVTGTFQNDEALKVSAVSKSTSNGLATEKGALTDTLHNTWLQDAMETARNDIQVVAGSGDIRGVWRYNLVSYAFRDNAGGTAVDMWKSTTAGWTQVALGNRVSFTAGTTAFLEAETLTGGTSTATATINRVVVQSGDWSTNDAAGYLVIGTVTNSPYQAETGTSASGSATLSGAETANTLAVGGRFEFRNSNFYGHSGGLRMYGVDGVSLGFEFDGAVFVPIITGMTTDTPNHLAIHKNHLFYSFSGGSVQHGGTGTPYVWSVITGASEIGIGEEVTGFLEDVASTLIIYGLNSVKILYGNNSTDWSMDGLAGESGAVEWSIQNVIRPMVMEADQIIDLRATKDFGNFNFGHLSKLIDPLLRLKRENGATVTASVKSRVKKQYRVFWSDGTGLVMDFSGKNPAVGKLKYGKTVKCCSSVKDTDDEEWILFGSTDGYVYRLDAGTNFDGSSVESYLRLPFNHSGSPFRNKKYHKTILECNASPDTIIKVTAVFSSGDPDNAPASEQSLDIFGGGGFYDEMLWDEFFWDAQIEGTGRADIPGRGNNVSLTLFSDLTYEEPHTMTGITLYYSNLGQAK